MRLGINGISLNVELAGSGEPLLLLHGFTGAASTWQPFVARVAPRWRTAAVDLIGHGESSAPPDPERYRMERCVEDLVAVLDVLGFGQASVVGYSMGARVALQLSTAAPERVNRLVLESGSPGLASAAERDARVAADERLADQIERDGLAAFIDYWERLPLFASQTRRPAEAQASLRAQRLRNDPTGLANSLRGMGTGRQSSLWERLPALSTQTLLVVGELDDKYCQIAKTMAAALPAARIAIVPNAGHAVHLERPDEFGDLVEGFLDAPQSVLAAPKT